MDRKAKTRAKALRRNATDAEKRLWQHLRNRELGRYKFRRQQPLGRCIVDFVCFEKKLVVELDGGQHLDQAGHDSRRDAWLQGQGFRVLRFWNDAALKAIDSVKEAILSALEEKEDREGSDNA